MRDLNGRQVSGRVPTYGGRGVQELSTPQLSGHTAICTFSCRTASWLSSVSSENPSRLQGLLGSLVTSSPLEFKITNYPPDSTLIFSMCVSLHFSPAVRPLGSNDVLVMLLSEASAFVTAKVKASGSVTRLTLAILGRREQLVGPKSAGPYWPGTSAPLPDDNLIRRCHATLSVNPTPVSVLIAISTFPTKSRITSMMPTHRIKLYGL